MNVVRLITFKAMVCINYISTILCDSTFKVRNKTGRFGHTAGPGHQVKERRKWPSNSSKSKSNIYQIMHPDKLTSLQFSSQV